MFFKYSIVFIKNRNLHDILCYTIKKNMSKDNFFLYITNSDYLLKNILIKYFLLILSFFIHLKLYFINYFPLNLNELLDFYLNSNISISCSLINDKVSNITLLQNYIDVYDSNLVDPQKIFFKKINEELLKENSPLIRGLELFMKEKHFTESLLWEISYEGDIAINIFTDIGIQNIFN